VANKGTRARVEVKQKTQSEEYMRFENLLGEVLSVSKAKNKQTRLTPWEGLVAGGGRVYVYAMVNI